MSYKSQGNDLKMTQERTASRPTLVLVPGLLCDPYLFSPQVAALSDAAEVMVADVSQDDSLAGMADRILATAPETFALAGLSMGGYVAQEVMRRAPHRVSRLALLDTNARADREEQITARKAQMALAADGRLAEVVDQLMPFMVHADRLKDDAFVAPIRDMMLRVGPEAFVRQQTAIMTRGDGREDLRGVSVPTLCLVGRQDAITPPKVHQEMAERLQDGVVVEIEDCGHLATLEQPQAVTACLRYWLLR